MPKIKPMMKLQGANLKKDFLNELSSSVLLFKLRVNQLLSRLMVNERSNLLLRIKNTGLKLKCQNRFIQTGHNLHTSKSVSGPLILLSDRLKKLKKTILALTFTDCYSDGGLIKE